jgi:hypothetical protein
VTGEARAVEEALGEQESRERSDARYRAPGAAPLATRRVPASGLVGRIKHGLIDWAKTAAITLGTMYVIGWLAVTIGVAWMGRTNAGFARFDNTMEKQFAADVMREYALPKDASISVAEAGRAFVALQPARKNAGGYIVRSAPVVAEPPWRGMELDSTLFVGAGNSSYEGPSSGVINASAKGFNAREREVLRLIATAPQWRDWDIVARAPKLDIIGARFEIPFGKDVHIYEMPILSFGVTKEYGYAAVSRAAWHLSEGRRDSAETILRAIVSNGFALSDNASSAIDQLIGNVIVGIGKDALIRFYSLSNDPRGPAIEAAVERARRLPAAAGASILVRDFVKRIGSIEEAIDDPALGRGIRMEMLGVRARASCGDARELVFGQRAETRAVFDRARADLARYPSERAVIDLLQNSTHAPVSQWLGTRQDNAAIALDMLGRIYFNPRLPSCAVIGLGSRLY